MNVPVSSIAKIYQVGREHVYRIKRRHGLTIDQVAQPDIVFEKLLAGRKCPLRTLLSDPATRRAIQSQLNSNNCTNEVF